MYDLIVIGGGASGLCTALRAKANGKKVLIIEKEDKVGKKILVTGNGKCNLSNVDISVENYNTNFVKKIIKTDVVGFINKLGISTTTINGKIYPRTESALTVVNKLRDKLDKKEIVLSDTVEKIEKVDDYYVINGYKGKNVALCTGSGATKGAFSHHLYTDLGHSATPLKPSIVPLLCDNVYIKNLANLRAKVQINLYQKNKVYSQKGEILFKNNGISGICSMMISSFIARNEGDYLVKIDFCPDLELKEVEDFCREYPVDGLVHQAIAQSITKQARDKKESIPFVVKNFTLTNVRLGDFSLAQVACGGLKVEEFDDNLMSKLHKGLYAGGEVLDVDGDCGGYNLHWAIASGIKIGDSIC